MTPREHPFPNGDVLQLTSTKALALMHGIEVFEISYGMQDGEEFQTIASEYCLTSEDANQLFELRRDSADPSRPVRPDGGAYGLVMDVLRIYLGETSMRPTPLPDTWQDMFKHVVKATTSEMLEGDDDDRILELYSGGDVMSRIYHAADGQEVTIPIQTVMLLFGAVTTFALMVKRGQKGGTNIPVGAGA